ncbi:hypothetical protein BU23DRAFT_558354 [Bimuria novae-zelandiae CBS 107.79]|uniref:Uncharacterized protein n=1 Tax=Bimuria novae-zelandiae CBS 107.79 TaxID=1447943 RepID=A0A6A5UUY9_9PLEO|nr:hypothetical protein BU23DRAFT_558354 [Bimuria novae-zelandiae CBS 107.79]
MVLSPFSLATRPKRTTPVSTSTRNATHHAPRQTCANGATSSPRRSRTHASAPGNVLHFAFARFSFLRFGEGDAHEGRVY